MKEPQFPPPEKQKNKEVLNKVSAEEILSSNPAEVMGLLSEYCAMEEVDSDVVADVVTGLSVKLAFSDSGYSAEEKDTFIASVRTIPSGERSDALVKALEDLAWQASYLEEKYGTKSNPLVSIPDTADYDVLFGLSVSDGSGEEMGVDLEHGPDYSELNQMAIRLFMEKLDEDDRQRVEAFALRYGQDGLRAAAALRDEEGYMQAVWYGEMLAYDDVDYIPKEVFLTYVDIMDQSRDLVNTIGFDDELSAEVRLSLEQKVSDKARTILVNKLDSLFDDVDGVGSYQETIDQLRDTMPQAVVLVEAFKAMRSEGIVNSVTDFEKVSVAETNEIDPRTEQLYKNNYTSERAGELLEKLTVDSRKEGFKSLSLSFGEELLSALYVIEDSEHKQVYVGGLNTNNSQDLKGANAGQAMMNEIENRYITEGWTLESVAGVRVAQSHIMSKNFIATDRLENDSEGNTRLKLLRNDEWQLESKDKDTYSREQIVSMAESGQADESGRIAVWTTKNEQETPGQLGNGYVATQLFGKGDRMYYLLEKSDIQ